MSAYTNLAIRSCQCQCQKSKQTQWQCKWQTGIISRVIVSVGFIVFLSSCLTVRAVKAEYFSSVDALQSLSLVEESLVNATRDYLAAQQQELAKYRNYIAHVRAQQEEANEDLEAYVGNPINAFTLIKRLTNDWKHMHALLMQNKPWEQLRIKIGDLTRDLHIPDQNDLIGVAKGLTRLQSVYKLNTSLLADGEINGVYAGNEMNWYDCFVLAVQLYELQQYEQAIDWFEETLELLDEAPESIKNSTRFDLEIYEYLAIAYHDIGKPDMALDYIEDLLALAPEHPAKHIKMFIELNRTQKSTGVHPVHSAVYDWYANYTRLCQGRSTVDTERTEQRLRCHLDSSRHAYFTLAPLKVEQILLDPEITLYYDMLNDRQIEHVLKEAETQEMQRSSVTGTRGTSVVMDVRVSQQTWLTYTSPIMQTIQRHVRMISGFDMSNAEIMQLANYGIGGQYEPHHDYFGTNLPSNYTYIGDRIATSMFYLSDVEQGGYTVFPKINVYLKPIKGALVMWYNLRRSLDYDVNTLHAGCPVIRGSKRIGNVWVHSGLQELRRPCALTPD